MNKKKSKKSNKRRNKAERSESHRIVLNAQLVSITSGSALSSLNISELIANDVRFDLFQALFQQWKLNSITIQANPLLSQGNSPPPLYCYLSYRGTDTGVTADTVQTTGRKISSSLKGSTLSFSSTGRQNDFHYWFDTLNTDMPSLCFYLATPTSVTVMSDIAVVVVVSVNFSVRFATLFSTSKAVQLQSKLENWTKKVNLEKHLDLAEREKEILDESVLNDIESEEEEKKIKKDRQDQKKKKK